MSLPQLLAARDSQMYRAAALVALALLSVIMLRLMLPAPLRRWLYGAAWALWLLFVLSTPFLGGMTP